ncbi:MAG: TOBE domain-containing protein [Candidatus Thiodiazotropha sp.]
MLKEDTYIPSELKLTSDFGGSITAKRIALLEAICSQGSISAAAKKLNISYRSAWDALNEMNNLWESPLVAKQQGGKHGGKTLLTQEGQKLIDAFKAVEAEYQHFTQTLSQNLNNFKDTQQYLRRLTMRTSARNQFHGKISLINSGPVNTEITLAINETDHLTSIITTDSVEQLGLSLGSDVYALIKASFVILIPADAAFASSARNRLCGTIRELRHGPINSEAIVALDGDKTLTAIITEESAKEMQLEPGSPVCALIKASHVILGVH